ncbi:Calx-beta domain-containing protein [Piscinibacter defluvii]|uniref:Calx-beta domain-containing protein n=1 Tax=Piscinibacter defluvii TaxID=1796922 RepID=UPI000FDDA563|nr:Calx-beta domain-containing protein [Piscinibacter defluvii]
MPSLSVDHVVVSEADGFVDIVIRLTDGGAQPISVNYAFGNITAVNGGGSPDYSVTSSGTLTFDVGVTTQTIRVNLSDNAAVEAFESFRLSLSGATNGALISNTDAVIGIVDNEAGTGTPGLSVRDVVVDEKAGTATFVVLLGGPAGQASGGTVTVDYETYPGTASAGSDYTTTSGTLTFEAGQTVKTVTVSINNDNTPEGAERFFLDLDNVTGGAVILDSRGVGTIGANDATPVAKTRITISDAIVSESDGYVDIVVSLSAPAQAPVSVSYYTANSTAISGGGAPDYFGYGGTNTLNFAVGETTKVVRVELADDITVEGYENFYFILHSASANADIVKEYATIGIVDDDNTVDAPSIVVRDAVVDEKAGTATFVIMLGGPSGQSSNSTVTVDYQTTAGTAAAGTDYATTSGTLTFAAGESVKTVTVDINDDNTPEGAERFFLDLDTPTGGAVILDSRGVATIGASDATSVSKTRITVSDAIVSENDGYVDIVVSLSAPAQAPVTVNYYTSNSTAISGGGAPDYYGVNTNLLNFAVGETTKVVRIELEDSLDTDVEGFENFYFVLYSASANADIVKDYANIGIVDDDNTVDAPIIVVRDAVVDEKAGTATFVVMLGGPNGQSSNSTVTVDYGTTAGTATAGADYATTSGTLTFAAGESVKTVTVDIADDNTPEGAERFFLDLDTATGGALILDSRGVATIGASDATQVSKTRISVSDAIVSESDGYIDVVVSLSAPAQAPVTVSYYTDNSTAISGGGSPDYFGSNSHVLNFAVGETTKVVRFELEDSLDTDVEGYENFYFVLHSASANADIVKDYANIGIVDDDNTVDNPIVIVRDAVVDEKAGTATFVVMLGGPNGQSSNSTVTVDYRTTNGTATAGTDYTAILDGTLTFAAGESVKTVTVDINDDGATEGAERFFLDLDTATGGAVILDSRGVATIGASDGTQVSKTRISVSDAIVSESDGYIDVVVSLSAPAQAPVTVSYYTSNSTAVSGGGAPDYFGANSHVLNFAVGETTKVVRFEIEDSLNTDIENYENFYFILHSASANADIVKDYANIGIVDDDNTVDNPIVVVRDAVVDEKAGTATFVVMLGGPNGQSSNNTVTVDYDTTTAGTATAGSDFTATSGTLTFAAGETVKTVTVDIRDDATTEGRERVNLVLSDATGGALIVDANGVAEIGASDAGGGLPPTISVADATVAEGDGYIDVVVSLSAPAQTPVTVNYYTSNSTAVSGGGAPDYWGPGTHTLNFAAGETTKVVRIEIEDDFNPENIESFNFNLITPSGATIAKAVGVINIVDDDNPGVNVYSYGRSDDVYTVASNTDVLVENAGGGTDLVRSSITYTLRDNLENLTLTGSAGISGIGNTLNNVLTGNSGNNRLNGDSGNDTLDGRGGADTMTGGAGNDNFLVDNAGDIVVEAAGGGTDTVLSNRTYTLLANLENLTLTGSSAINGTGNTLNNVLTGNGANNSLNGGSGNDTLIGGLGADTMIGGAGNDLMVVDNAGDVVTEAAAGGTDTVQINRSYTLLANFENLTLTGSSAINGTGNALNNVLTGNGANNSLNGGSGNDTLIGGLGADTMIGGAGNDLMVVDNAGDVVTEAAAGGTDTVQSSRSYSLLANFENLTLTGSSAINGTGNTLNNVLTGNGARNSLNGGSGNDTLNGGLGADTMIGGTGNDTFLVDNVGDVVTEAAAGGTDTVQVNRTYTLLANLENLTLTGSSAINGTGNTLNNVLTGNGANNVLNGGTGNDTMIGGAGNDTYVVNVLTDVVTEATGGGTDTVQSGLSYTLGLNVERLTLTGSSAVNGTGNSLNNLLTGNSANNSLNGSTGNDTLNGGAGNDTMIGGAGNDALTGGLGNDTFHFTSLAGSDAVTDFNSVNDTFRFSQATIRIGDGDTVVDNGQTRSNFAPHAASAEVVVVTDGQVFGTIDAGSAAAVIGSASSNYAVGATRLFVVDNGAQTGIFLFTSSGANALVSASELTQIALVDGSLTSLSDYTFGA